MGFDDTFVRLALRVPVNGIDESADNPAVTLASGAVFDSAIDLDNGYGCKLNVNALDNPNVLRVQAVDLQPNGNLVDDQPFANDNTNNAGELEVTFSNAPTREIDCRFDGDNGTGRASGSGPIDQSIGEVAVIVNAVAVRVHWIDILENICAR